MTRKPLPASFLEKVICHQIEQDPDCDELRIPISALNDIEQRVTLEYTHERVDGREFIVFSTCDLDATDVPEIVDEV